MTSGNGCNSNQGSKTIYVRFRDNAWTQNISSYTTDSTYYDTVSPTISSITLGDDTLKAGQSTTVTFTFSDASGVLNGSSFTLAGDVTVQNGDITNLSAGNGLTRTATFTATNIHDLVNVITAGTSWTDMAGNSASAGGSSPNYTITPPFAFSGTYNANEGNRVITILFDEVINASLTDLSKIHVRQAGASSGGVTLTGASIIDVDSTTLSITTTEVQRIAIKALANTYGVSNLEVDLDAGAVFELDLSFANEADNDNDISYTPDETKPLISSLNVDDSMLTEADVGAGQFIVTTIFNEDMNTAIYPVLEFLPDVSSTLSCGGAWSNTTTFLYTCDVTDADVEIDDIDIRVTGARDIYTNNQMLPDLEVNKFSIDTVKPVVGTLSVNDEWVGENNVGVATFVVTVNFAEAMDTSLLPGIVFLPSVSSTLDCQGAWSDSDTYLYSCNVTDADVEQADIDIRITNAKDLVGNNMVSYTESDAFNVDTIKPTISITDNASATWVNSDTIASNPVDGLGIANTKWIIRDNNTCNSSLDATLNSGTLADSVITNSETTYYGKYICFRTMDNADNKQYVSSTIINYLDTSDPITTILGHSYDWNTSTLSITLDCNGVRSGCANTYYRINSAETWTTYVGAFGVDDANNLIEYYSVDNATNNETIRIAYAAQDRVAPAVGTTILSGFIIDGNQIWGTGTILGGLVTDVTSDMNILSCEYDANINGAPSWLVADWNSDTNSCQKTNFTIVAGETYTFNTRIRDNATNLGTGTETMLYVADNIDPKTLGVVGFAPNGDNNWYITDVNFIITPADAVSGVMDTNYCTDVNDTCTPNLNYISEITLSADGSHYIRFRSIDNATNLQTTQSSGLIKIDQNKPITDGNITSGTQEDTNYYSTDVNYTLYPTDDMSGVMDTNYCVSTADTCTPSTQYAGPILLETDGNHYVRFRSIDNAGNLQSTQSSGLIQIDKTNPVLTLSGTSTTNSINLILSVDDLSNCRYDSNLLKTYGEMSSSTDANNITSKTWVINGLSPNTTYTYNVQCRNRVYLDGNSNVSLTTDGGGRSYSPGTTTVSRTTQTLDYNSLGIREALEGMRNDNNQPLYSSNQIEEIISNKGDYEFNRTVHVEKIVLVTGLTRYRITVTTEVLNKNNNDLKNVKIIVEVPKEVTKSASNIESLIPFTILVDDPIIEFTIPSLKKGESATIEYTVIGTAFIDANKVKFSDPVIRDATIIKPVVPVQEPPVVKEEVDEEIVDVDEEVVVVSDEKQVPLDLTGVILVVLVIILLLGFFVIKSKKNKTKLGK